MRRISKAESSSTGRRRHLMPKCRIAGRIHRRVAKLMERRGLGPQADPEEADTLLRDQPLLAELYGASVAGRVAVGRVPAVAWRKSAMRSMRKISPPVQPSLRRHCRLQRSCQRLRPCP